MLKNKALKKAFRDFNQAGQTLSTLWQDADAEVTRTIENIRYPFNKDFSELSYDIHTWCEDVIEILEDFDIQKHFTLENNELISYTMAVKDTLYDREIEKGGWFNKGWFYRVKLNEEYNAVEVFDEATGNTSLMEYDEFKESFIIINKEIYNLGLIATSNNYVLSKVQDIAMNMGERLNK